MVRSRCRYKGAMIRVRLLGGVKRALGREYVDVDSEQLVLRDLLSILAGMSMKGTLYNPSDLIIVVNGVDSSLLGGMDTIIRRGDNVTVLTVVHGGDG
jgi:molybdopterin converting factor small subunit